MFTYPTYVFKLSTIHWYLKKKSPVVVAVCGTRRFHIEGKKWNSALLWIYYGVVIMRTMNILYITLTCKLLLVWLSLNII